jgi:hypothetical protein
MLEVRKWHYWYLIRVNNQFCNYFPTQVPPSDDESSAEVPVDADEKSIVDGIFESADRGSPGFISWCIRDEVTEATTAATEETAQVSFQCFLTVLTGAFQ